MEISVSALEFLEGEVVRNLSRMFQYHQPKTVYLVNDKSSPEPLIGLELLKSATSKLDTTLANNLAAAGGGGPTVFYLDINLDQFHPYTAENIYIHLERSASRLAAMLKQVHRLISYTGLVVTVGSPSYRSELFAVDSARAMYHLCKGLNNHLPHSSLEMAGYFANAIEAQKLGRQFVPIHAYSFSIDPAQAVKPTSTPAIPDWSKLVGDTPLDELLNEQATSAGAASAESTAPVDSPAPVADGIAETMPLEPEQGDVAPLELDAAATVDVANSLQDVLSELEIGSKLLSAGGSLRSTDSTISFVTFPAVIGNERVRIGYCQNGTFVVVAPDADSVSLVLGSQLVLDLVDLDPFEPFAPDAFLYLQGELDRNDLMDYYLQALASTGDDTAAIDTYAGGAENLREQLEKFFEVLPAKLSH